MSDPKPRLAQLLQRGLAAQRSGDLDAAESALHEALRSDPRQPDALQLLGLLARRRGDAAAAERWLRLSLQSAPAQPHVWNNLGNLLERGGRVDAAREALERAVALQPGYADAHYNLARVLRTLGRPTDAATALQRAFELQPASAGMLHLRGNLEGDAGRLDAAMVALDAALQLAPQQAALHHDRAVLLQRAQRPAEALASHRQALALGVDAADAHYNLGNTLQSLGRADEAVAAYRQALQRAPGHALALYDLARLRWRIGDADFTAELDAASRALPAAVDAERIKGQLLWRAERFADAAESFASGLRKRPDDAELLDGLARSLARRGDIAAALDAHARAIASRPGNADFRVHHATSLLMAGEPQFAQAEAEVALRLAPEDQHALALLGLAWRALGDPREAWLNDTERLVQSFDLPAPPGFASTEAFNDALTAALEAMHHDRQAPVDQTLRGGTQSLGTLFEQHHPLVRLLREQLAAAVSSYVAALPDDDRHPFLRRRTGQWRFTDSWSSRLTRGGFHTDHVHPHGWVSSVYYVRLPAAVNDAASQQGWLRFGQPDFDVGLGPLVRRVEQPRVGRLILFPSMMWHGTVPFASDGIRLTVAFDVMPAGAEG